MPKTVAVIGASNDRTKFSNKAVRAYLAHGWDVYPVNPKETEIEGRPAFRTARDIPAEIDRVTLYLPPAVGLTILEDIAARHPDEFYVNPGAESEELVRKSKDLGLDPILACSIIEIGAAPNQFPDE